MDIEAKQAGHLCLCMGIYNHDAHVRAWYDVPELHYSKFIGQTRAVRLAHETSLSGFFHDQFGDANEGGYYCRVLFQEAPFIVCFVEDSQGFVTELSSDEYEAAWAEWVEVCEAEEQAQAYAGENQQDAHVWEWAEHHADHQRDSAHDY